MPIFGGIAIPGYMMWAAILYALVGSLADLPDRPAAGAASTSTLERYNADFRYRMTRIRENAESIALYRGEADEERRLRGAFARIYATWWTFMKYTKRLTWLTAFYGQAASVFPIVVAAPQYFAGKIPLGVLTQTAGAFGQVQGSLSWFVDTYRQLAAWKAVVDRLTTFGEAMAKAKTRRAPSRLQIAPAARASLVLEGVDVRAAERRAAARERQPRPSRRASRRRARSLGQRQDHAVPRARRAVAVRPGPDRHSRRTRACSSCRRSPTCRSARCSEVLSYPATPEPLHR